MSSRKPTVDDLDDVDDEDGSVEDEDSQETDLTLVVESADEAITGSSAVEDEEVAEEEA
ncbi:MAG TPA: hypothetical protein VJ808_05665 [Gemmatimonadales bacterium]|nr:hypothetical protein [Gemmatimonadales bacterium]